ncbi:MAG: diphthine synthase [Archaeoglobaceae archaeon]
MLTFVGLGLCDAKDITFRGYEAVKEADVVYAEFYTSRLSVPVEEIKNFLGKEIRVLEREELENKSARLIDEAKKKKVVILVAGDPMIATTHIALLLEAKKAGVKTKVVNNASIINAVCTLTGLQNYRFGKSATVSWHKSRAFVDVIKANLSIDAHTLLFLDLNPPMRICDAIPRILEFDESLSKHFAVGIARAGSDEAIVKCDFAEKLIDFDFGEPLHTLVFLAKRIHFMEYECLRLFSSAPEELREWVL